MTDSEVHHIPRHSRLTWSEKLGAVRVMVQLPLILLWNVIISPWSIRNRTKTWKRVIVDTYYRTLCLNFSIPQAQLLTGSTINAYNRYVTTHQLPTCIETLEPGSHLLWLGHKQVDYVILYFHGGGFAMCLTASSMSFWRHLQLELGQQGFNVGIAILHYSLSPEGPFPTQLRQAVLGIQALLKQGLKPQNLYLAGDSCGGNLVTQVLLHVLHSHPSVPTLKISGRFGGACMISPWASLTYTSDCCEENDKRDIVPVAMSRAMGLNYLTTVPNSQRLWVEHVITPSSRFEGLESIVGRILVTSGEFECLRDDIAILARSMQDQHTNVQLAVQRHGVHIDPIYEFVLPGKIPSGFTAAIMQWFRDGFESS